MGKSVVKKYFMCMLCIVLLGWTSSLWAQAEFKARLFTGGGPNTESSINVRIKIDSFTTVDEVVALSKAFSSGGEDGFFAVFNKMNKAYLRFLGAQGLNIGLHAAYEKPTDNGYKILLYGKSQSVEPGSNRLVYGGFLFLVVILDLDKNYKGEGRIYEDARIQFTQQGTIEMDSYTRAPKVLVGVSIVK
jgi:hypothetical protein